MKLQIDVHCHTVASGHAYSTIDEMASFAKMNDMELIALTDHTPAMPGGAHIYYFHNLRVLPQFIEGVRILKGAEVNILPGGKLDLDDDSLSHLELTIASLHIPCIKPSDRDEHTQVLMEVMKNPYISILGHLGDMRYDFDIARIVKQAKHSGTLIEINNNSLRPGSFRVGGTKMISDILIECRKQKTRVVIGSDAHYKDAIGKFAESIYLIRELDFPEDLIVKDQADLLRTIGEKRNIS